MRIPSLALVVIVGTLIAAGAGCNRPAGPSQAKPGVLVETDSAASTAPAASPDGTAPGTVATAQNGSTPPANGPIRATQNPAQRPSTQTAVKPQTVITPREAESVNAGQSAGNAAALQELEAQRKAIDGLRVQQEQQQRELEEARRKLAEEQERQAREQRLRQEQEAKTQEEKTANARQQPPRYTGPTSGTITWEGTVRGTELITIENDQASTGTVTGSLPGVLVLVQPSDLKKVGIASAPGPSNQYRRLVFRVTGNGPTRVTLRWSLP